MRRGSRLVKIGVVVLVALMIGGGIGLGSYIYIRNQQIEETQQFSDELQEGLVRSCARNGNPLRKAVQKILREQIARSNAPTIRRFFPQIPPAELERLIKAQREANLATIREIAPLNCAEQYSRP